MLTAGVDVGTSGVRAVVLDSESGGIVATAELATPPGRRSPDGGHEIDEPPVVDAALQVLTRACAETGQPPLAISVAGTAGTLCFRDARNRVCAQAVMYDDARFGAEVERVAAWRTRRQAAARVLPITDAVLEALGARPGFTDWTNARKLGWDAAAVRWPPQAWTLREAGFLPRVEPPASPAGTCRLPAARGALLTRGVTDSCAMHIAVAGFRHDAWSVSLGTTVTWKAALPGRTPDPVARLPRGAYAHRLAAEFWLAAAAGNSGGGALAELDPEGADLADLDNDARLPSGFAAYPLSRRGERFPVADPAFAGFGLPHRSDPRLHAATLEGVAFVIRLGIERIVAAGVPRPGDLLLTGGGAASNTWTAVIASATGIPIRSHPDRGPATGAAMLAAAALSQSEALQPPEPPLSTGIRVDPTTLLAGPLEERYGAFLDCLSELETPIPAAAFAAP